MMDENLIDEVAHHGVIFNRQKYYLNGSGSAASSVVGGSNSGKYETKDEAWQIIAMKLRTDVETCKKRWKYLRERYVSQRKQGDPPIYEHLSRPYLEKMKFLDQHIQPRKSYRNVPNFLTSPHSANSSNYSEYNMDSKSNGSVKNIGHFGNTAAVQQHYHHPHDQQHAMNALSSAAAAASVLENANGLVKIEADQVFRDFAAAVASQQLQQISQSQMSHQHQQSGAVAADSSQNYQEPFRDAAIVGSSAAQSCNGGGAGITSSSSSMKSPLSSPLPGINGGQGQSISTPQQVAAHSSSSNNLPAHGFNDSNNDELDSSTSSNYNTKKPRVQLNTNAHHISNNNNTAQNNITNTNNNANNNTTHSHFVDDTDDDSTDDNSSNLLQPQTILSEPLENHFNSSAASNTGALQRTNGQQTQQQSMFPANADFLYQFYQQLPQQQQQQTSTPHTQQQLQQQQPQHFSKFQTPHTVVAPTQNRSSEHLIGEMVTTELLKMSKERRKNVQKRILEILFFDD